MIKANPIQYKITSPIGILYLVASLKGLQGIYWTKQPVKLVKFLDRSQPSERILDDSQQQLDEYFSGRRRNFDIPLDVEGTVFQKKVWQELAKIPFGQTVSYRDIAKKIKNPKAVRAVGSANGRNPVCIVIPCHRVIAADGSIGGYTGGIRIKQQLLTLEQA
ncbi:MAG: methylated-DNA--[protein]-cysteine S-methyltransferase [Candidatus Omnitrophica bacterium]|nr:methylated-DNA--[protein]-cysteine S-methyltransferase [Candidatus Omnitrophota bacterium]